MDFIPRNEYNDRGEYCSVDIEKCIPNVYRIIINDWKRDGKKSSGGTTLTPKAHSHNDCELLRFGYISTCYDVTSIAFKTGQLNLFVDQTHQM